MSGKTFGAIAFQKTGSISRSNPRAISALTIAHLLYYLLSQASIERPRWTIVIMKPHSLS